MVIVQMMWGIFILEANLILVIALFFFSIFDDYMYCLCILLHYVIKFVSDLWQVGDFLRVLQFPPSIKLTATI